MTTTKGKSKATTKQTKTTKPKAKSIKTQQEVSPVQETPNVVESVSITPTNEPSNIESTNTDLFNGLIKEVSVLRSQCTSIIAKIRNLKVQTEREKKVAVKEVKKRKMSNRAPSGFLKPTAISNELADFVGKPYGSEMARREVTLFLNQYIRDNNLQNPTNGRIILADEKLRKLLKLDKSTELTYFNLQSHMTSLFPKKKEITHGQ
jgi:chromatin remodeling complex protein RSC6